MKDISSKLVLCNALFSLCLSAASLSLSLTHSLLCAFQKTNKTQKIPLSGIARFSATTAPEEREREKWQEEEQIPMLKN